MEQTKENIIFILNAFIKTGIKEAGKSLVGDDDEYAKSCMSSVAAFITCKRLLVDKDFFNAIYEDALKKDEEEDIRNDN